MPRRPVLMVQAPMPGFAACSQRSDAVTYRPNVVHRSPRYVSIQDL